MDENIIGLGPQELVILILESMRKMESLVSKLMRIALRKMFNLCTLGLVQSDEMSTLVKGRGTSILEEVRNIEIPGPTQQLLFSKYHDFLAIFALAHSKINQIA